ncbi:hypothetical protein ACFV19_29500 [Streptomyces griseoluteus]|uniref:ATP-dependent DNA ligase n=1 Tax=Streptomyces griseoluteus TaxID=29306 RepID=UPI00369A9422
MALSQRVRSERPLGPVVRQAQVLPPAPSGLSSAGSSHGVADQSHAWPGRVVLRSRRGTEMLPAFPEIGADAAQLPDAAALDGELVVWDTAGRLTFEQLQNRLQRRGARAARAAGEWSAHFVASMDRLVVLRRAGRPGDAGRHAGGTGAGGRSRRRRRRRPQR